MLWILSQSESISLILDSVISLRRRVFKFILNDIHVSRPKRRSVGHTISDIHYFRLVVWMIQRGDRQPDIKVTNTSKEASKRQTMRLVWALFIRSSNGNFDVDDRDGMTEEKRTPMTYRSDPGEHQQFADDGGSFQEGNDDGEKVTKEVYEAKCL